MAAGDLVTADFMFEIDGHVFGAATDVEVAEVVGLTSMPGVRASETDRARDHGAYLGDDYLDTRKVSFELRPLPDSAAELRTILDQWSATMSKTSSILPLDFQLPGYPKLRLNVRPRRREVKGDRLFTALHPAILVEFAAGDPRIYSTVEHTAVIDLASGVGGVALPLRLPLSFNTTLGYDDNYPTTYEGGVATLETGRRTITNAGNYPVRPTARIQGPVDSPRIELIRGTTFRTLEFDISLAADEHLDVDFDARTVLLQGLASRYETLSTRSRWFELEAGDQDIRFAADTPQTGATLTLTWRDGYML